MIFLRHWTGEILLVAGFIVFASLPTAFALSGGFHSEDDGPKPNAAGPPCRPISKAEFDRGWKKRPQRFQFGDAVFERRRGDAHCTTRAPGGLGPPYATCEFTAPVEVAVTFQGHVARYDVGVGNSAWVDARRQGLRCVVTGRFKMPTD
jgi:hypothetical protein